MSFIAMLVIFYFITSCEADSQEGVCFYRNEVTMMAAGTMFALIGLRYMKDKKVNKKKGKLPGDPSKKQA